MADSKTRINIKLFQFEAEKRTSDKSPHARGSLEIPVNDLNEFFSLAMALEPTENWQGEQVIKMRCAAWHKETKNGNPFESLSVTPDRAAEWKEEDLMTPHTAKPPLTAATVIDPDEEL